MEFIGILRLPIAAVCDLTGIGKARDLARERIGFYPGLTLAIDGVIECQ
jgi:hypothetical protein